MLFDPRKERSCSKVLPVDPAATRLKTTWNDKGEDTKFDPFSISFSKTRFVISRLESVLEETAALISLALDGKEIF